MRIVRNDAENYVKIFESVLLVCAQQNGGLLWFISYCGLILALKCMDLRQIIISMSLKKTDTLALDQNQKWGELSSLVGSQALPTFPLSTNQILIGRNAECGICINDKRLSGKHCSISKQGDKVTITDLSTNGTFIGTKKIGKGSTVQLKHQDQIWLLTFSKVPIKETIGFRLFLESGKEEVLKNLKSAEQKRKQEQEKQQKENQQKKEREEQQRKKKEEQQKKRNEQNAASSKLAQSIKDQITCAFCTEIMSIPVSVQPCNHRFCGGCLSELVQKKKDACIICRKQLTTAVRDAAFTSIIEDYLKSHPDQKRDPKEEQDLKAKNIFGFDPINIHQKIHGKPVVSKAKVDKPAPPARGRGRTRVSRAVSDLSASDDDEKDKCRQCLASRNGFQCSATQVHVGCHNCGKLIAQRDDPKLLQSCTLCTTYFCNLYYPPCKPGNKLAKLSDCRQKCKIDSELLRGNKFQFEAIRNYLLLKKMNSRDIFDHMMELVKKNKFSYLMDRKVMKVPPLVAREVKLDNDSVCCDQCWNDLWFQMVLAYRIEMAPNLPPAVRDRPICYWGINCRTMDHNVDHAKKYNHSIYQSRF